MRGIIGRARSHRSHSHSYTYKMTPVMLSLIYSQDALCRRRTLHDSAYAARTTPQSHTHALTLNCSQGPSLLEEFELLEQQKLQEDYWKQQHQKKYEHLRGVVQQRKHKQKHSSVTSSVRQSVLSYKQQQPEEVLQQGLLSLQLRLVEEGLNSRLSPRQVSSAHTTIFCPIFSRPLCAHRHAVSLVQVPQQRINHCVCTPTATR